jgi:hypothetical protein
MSRGIDDALLRLSSEVDATIAALRTAASARRPAERPTADAAPAIEAPLARPVPWPGTERPDPPPAPAPPAPAPTVYAPPPPPPQVPAGAAIARSPRLDLESQERADQWPAAEPEGGDAPEEPVDVQGAPEEPVHTGLPTVIRPRRLDWLLRRLGF